MDWSFFLELLPYIATLVAIFSGILIVYSSIKINDHRKNQAKIEEQIAKTKLEIIKNEYANKNEILKKTNEITRDISQSISQQLINDPSWLDNFMDQTGVTYRASVYGKRIGHFYYEKRKIAESAVQALSKRISDDDNSDQYCLLIDSGTTLYPVFQELTKKIQQNKEHWENKVCVVTNNIPGVQYLMKHCKEDPNDDYSEVIIDCFLVPGKPLSVYSAITGEESNRWLECLRVFLNSWDKRNQNIKILGFITGNYISRNETQQGTYYYPVARGEGHVEIKNVMANISDEIFLLSPLMKFSFANVQLLNSVSKYTIDRKNHEEAKKNPRFVKYEEIVIPQKKCHFFTTKRCKNNKFYRFSDELCYELGSIYGKDCINMPEVDIRRWIPNIDDNPYLEVERELPHKNLQSSFNEGNNIWDRTWVSNNANH